MRAAELIIVVIGEFKAVIAAALNIGDLAVVGAGHAAGLEVAEDIDVSRVLFACDVGGGVVIAVGLVDTDCVDINVERNIGSGLISLSCGSLCGGGVNDGGVLVENGAVVHPDLLDLGGADIIVAKLCKSVEHGAIDRRESRGSSLGAAVLDCACTVEIYAGNLYVISAAVAAEGHYGHLTGKAVNEIVGVGIVCVDHIIFSRSGCGIRNLDCKNAGLRAAGGDEVEALAGEGELDLIGGLAAGVDGSLEGCVAREELAVVEVIGSVEAVEVIVA